jgi:sulfide:quinone oxidoreductase
LIDPHAKRVLTSGGTYDADILVVALGADVRPDETPGMLEGGAEFYSVGGAEQLRDTLPAFPGGKVLISVLGPFFKCPAAPYEAAMMLHSYLGRRGVLDKSNVTVLTTLPMPIPISPEASKGIIAGLDGRGIAFHPSTKVERIDPATKTAVLADGSALDYDLFLGIPVHRAPRVVVDGGLTEDDGWIAVDHTTFATKFPGVYAAGDITSAPVPRVGVIAEGEAGTVADGIIHQIKGGAPPEPYSGVAQCYIEFGGAEVARFNVNFLSGPEPYGVFEEPTEELAASKKEFGRMRRKRWFGLDS